MQPIHETNDIVTTALGKHNFTFELGICYHTTDGIGIKKRQALERSLDGCCTRMIRAVLNINWQSLVSNEEQDIGQGSLAETWPRWLLLQA